MDNKSVLTHNFGVVKLKDFTTVEKVYDIFKTRKEAKKFIATINAAEDIAQGEAIGIIEYCYFKMII